MPTLTEPMTIGRVVAAFLDHARTESVARVHAERQRILRAFAKAHGDLPLADAKGFHLRFWVDSQTQWKSDWTKKGVIAVVQRAFNWALKLGYIERNPFFGVNHREGDPGRPMTAAEFAAAMRRSSVPFRRVLTFLRFTGCRPGECAAIEPADVDLVRGIVRLGEHKTARKTRRPRVIILHPVAARLIAFLLRNQIPNQTKLFINSRGTAWTRYAIACRMKRLRKRLKLPRDCKTYGLRHKFGTDAIRNGVELKTLSVLMGHTDTRSTQRYVHIADDYEHLAKAVRAAIKPG